MLTNSSKKPEKSGIFTLSDMFMGKSSSESKSQSPKKHVANVSASIETVIRAVRDARSGEVVHARGVAGSGKTKLALEFVKLSKSSFRVLYLNPHQRLVEHFEKMAIESSLKIDCFTPERLLMENVPDRYAHLKTKIAPSSPPAPLVRDILKPLLEGCVPESLSKSQNFNIGKWELHTASAVSDIVRKFTLSTSSSISAEFVAAATKTGEKLNLPIQAEKGERTNDDKEKTLGKNKYDIATATGKSTIDDSNNQEFTSRRLAISEDHLMKLASQLWDLVWEADAKIVPWFDAVVKMIQMRGESISFNYDWIFMDDVEQVNPNIVKVFLQSQKPARIIVMEGLTSFHPPSFFSQDFQPRHSFLVHTTLRFGRQLANVVNQMEALYGTHVGENIEVASLNEDTELHHPLTPPQICKLNESVTCIGSKKDLMLYGIQVSKLIHSGLLEKYQIQVFDAEDMKFYVDAIIDGWDLFVTSRIPSLKKKVTLPPKLSLFSDYQELLFAVNKKGDRRFESIADFTPSYKRILNNIVQSTRASDQMVASKVEAWKKEAIHFVNDLHSVYYRTNQNNGNASHTTMMSGSSSAGKKLSASNQNIDDQKNVLLITPMQARGREWKNMAVLEDFFEVYDDIDKLKARKRRCIENLTESSTSSDYLGFLYRQIFPLYLAITRARSKLFLNHQLIMLLKNIQPGIKFSSLDPARGSSSSSSSSPTSSGPKLRPTSNSASSSAYGAVLQTRDSSLISNGTSLPVGSGSFSRVNPSTTDVGGNGGYSRTPDEASPSRSGGLGLVRGYTSEPCSSSGTPLSSKSIEQ